MTSAGTLVLESELCGFSCPMSNQPVKGGCREVGLVSSPM